MKNEILKTEEEDLNNLIDKLIIELEKQKLVWKNMFENLKKEIPKEEHDIFINT